MNAPEPVPAGQHTPPAEAVDAAAYALATYGQVNPSSATLSGSQYAIAAHIVKAVTPHIRAQYETEFALLAARQQDACQETVKRAVQQARAEEWEAIRQLAIERGAVVYCYAAEDMGGNNARIGHTHPFADLLGGQQ